MDIAKRLGWDEPPIGTPREEPEEFPPSSAIPQGADFLANPPRQFRHRKWGIEYRLIQNTDNYVSYACTNEQQVDQVIFLKNRRALTIEAVKSLLKGKYKTHYFEDFNYPIASLIQEHTHSNNQQYCVRGQFSLFVLLELTGINPEG